VTADSQQTQAQGGGTSLGMCTADDTTTILYWDSMMGWLMLPFGMGVEGMPVKSHLVSAVPDTTNSTARLDLTWALTDLTADCQLPLPLHGPVNLSLNLSSRPSVNQSITRSVSQSINQCPSVSVPVPPTTGPSTGKEGQCPVAALYVVLDQLYLFS
jgi:hypothetical protein